MPKDILLPVTVNDASGVVNERGDIVVPFSKGVEYGPGDRLTTYAFITGNKVGLKDRGGKALIDPEGRQIIGMDWPEYMFTEPGLIVGGYALKGGGQTHEAYYDTTGKLLLQKRKDPCGQEQLLTGDQRVVWPLKPAKACTKG